MNNMRFDGYGYPDMNLVNNLLLQSNNQTDNMTNNMNSNMNSNMNQNQNMITNQNLATLYEGFIRGNLYNDLYDQYKNYRPTRLVPNNEQAELLLNVNQLTFATHEIKLYLDINPNDANMISLYNQYQKQASEAIKAYENKYGPIQADSLSQTNIFSWQAYAWPWETEDMQNVGI